MDKKWLLVSVALLVLIASNAFLVYTISEQRSSIDSLKQSNDKLLGQLSDSNKIIEDLRRTVDQQNKEISALQHDIDRYRNYTLVRLLISVNPTYLTSDFYSEMQAVEEAMKFIWDPLHIMFVFQIYSDASAPSALRYEEGENVPYIDKMLTLYSLPTVIAWVTEIDAVAGFAMTTSSAKYAMVISTTYLGAHLITHEFLHLLGFHDDVLYPWDRSVGREYIPRDWYPQIYQNIVKFEIRNPSVQ